MIASLAELGHPARGRQCDGEILGADKSAGRSAKLDLAANGPVAMLAFGAFERDMRRFVYYDCASETIYSDDAYRDREIK
jgi:hypothetical protein